MKILCLSDSHGCLPELDLTDVDLVLHAGDYSAAPRDDLYKQLAYYEQVFCPWVRRIAKKCQIYFISGNHEVFVEKIPTSIYLNDVWYNHNIDEEYLSFEEFNIYGFPWTPTFYNWGFNLDDTPEALGVKCQEIPDGVDILLTHGPPYGVLDIVPGRITGFGTDGFIIDNENHAGSKELRKRIERIHPKLVVCGHLHSNYGIEECNGIKFVGCSIVDEDYTNERPPLAVEI